MWTKTSPADRQRVVRWRILSGGPCPADRSPHRPAHPGRMSLAGAPSGNANAGKQSVDDLLIDSTHKRGR